MLKNKKSKEKKIEAKKKLKYSIYQNWGHKIKSEENKNYSLEKVL